MQTSPSLLAADRELASIENDHRRLLDQLDLEPAILVEGSRARAAWLCSAENLFQRARDVVSRAVSTNNAGQLEWIALAASEWQLAMSGRLNLPRDVRKEIGIEVEEPTEAAESVLVAPKATWDRTQLERQLQCESFYIGANRKVLAVVRRYRQLQRMQADRIHAEIPSTASENWQDWYDACRFLTLDILLGRVDFARLIDPSGYEFLETVWIDDVKQLFAYLLWEQSNCASGFEDEANYYFQACQRIDELLFRSVAKVSFDAVARWWKERYLTGSETLPANPQALEEIVRRKAQRIFEKTNRRDERANWAAAKKYVDAFYLQLLPAVQEKDPEAVRSIRSALLSYCDPQIGCELANGLEAAIASSFLDVSLLKP